ncbi:T9SS type A sorting domain-containing protein [Mariniflexile sp. HNIBRBA6329]|uniref:T9SS type A sorting domain-containing protein n=1 Tax=Mariniflexile sp. HNIBRBA6329 TaxID=3373088 RepID=UPI003745B6A4
MKRVTLRTGFVLLGFLISFFSLNAQKLLKEVSLKKQIENSSLVVEGKVVSKTSFWTNDGIICTANTVKVYKVFKGEQLATIDVITLGGIVELTALKVSHSLSLSQGDVGVFVLEESKIKNSLSNKSVKKQFIPYGAEQGFYKYNVYDDLAVNPFNAIKGISNTFHKAIINLTKRPITEMVKYDAIALTSKINKALAPTAITFSPTTVTAGTKNTITITIPGGATGDFGSVKGKVSFNNADEGGGGNYVDALDTQVTWSANSIIVEVPSEAGTGKIRVTNNDGSVRESTAELTVPSSEINVVYDADDTTDGMGGGDNGPLPAYAYRVQHIGQNNGGYTWEMQTDFFNDSPRTGAKAAFKRAFDNWVCSTGVNWTIKSTPTNVDVVEFESEPVESPSVSAPAVNVIRFDNGELDEITLGACYSWYKGCSLGGGNFQWFVAEMDIVFNDDVDWNFGSGPTTIAGRYDFESVALHELGHAHQLGHVINTNGVMNNTLQFNEDLRVLSAQDISAASTIQSRSTSTFVCASQPKMTNASCPLNVEEEELNAAINIYPNPSNGQFYVKNSGIVNLDKVVVYDVRGRLVSQFDMSNASRTKTINLLGASKGMYFVKIVSDRAEITKKILID